MHTKEEVYNIDIKVGEKGNNIFITPVAGRVIGLLIYHNKGDEFVANAGLKADDGTYISKMQHIRNYRSRESCYFTGCKPVDFQTQGKTYTLEITTEEAVANKDFKGQLILIYEDTRFNNCGNE
ncbi:hypothetical protein [Capnocytophaga gingivalis]|mgnify:FL=1|jgi:hypothetical protein|uniref:Uncharacterized protein n=1 Tax=Capnocytophaga gingivalis TaxID=1017 RepID=A0ABU5Y632_9FLAO|nr:hypothetical protein [Capnocytophaga gingivalis]EEK15254.1 hypothetical protein CAPGI0001_0475 [Capnocytophaga gingivalis ATCC 33624]MEB3039380.1 hypothetical protein [Capnocytophaga gingivalis]RKW12161.1 MAG: hypothetical protein D8H93_15930 [Capnocytophaga sp.]